MIWLRIGIMRDVLWNYFRMLTGKSTGKISVGRPRCTCEDNICMYLEEISINTRNWIDLAHCMEYWRVFLDTTRKFRFP